MLSKKSIIGFFWNFLEQLSRRGISVFVTLLLAYFLTPEDYGLVAMISLFLALGSALMESGFKQAIIRKVDLTNLDINTAFYANFIFAILAYSVLFVSAPYVASFYGEERLILLLRVASISIIFNAFQVVPSAIFTKEIDFKTLLKANVPATMLSGLSAVILAYVGLGVWSLISQTLISSLFISIFLWVKTSWRPSLTFDKVSFIEMYTYGYKLFLSSILDTIYKNIFVMLIAKMFTVSLAGLYFFADRIKELIISQLITSIQSVTFPALSSIQNEPERLKIAFQKIIQVMTFVFYPVLLIFVALSELIFKVVLPEQWLPAVPYLQLMCLSCLAIPIISVNLNIIKIKGKTDWYLYLEIIKKTTGFLTLYFTYEYGVLAILVGQICSQILNYYPSVYLSNKLIDYNLFQQVRDFLPSLLLSTIIALNVWYLQIYLNLSSALDLIVIGIFSLFLYIILSYIFKFKSLRLTLDMIKKLKSNS
ncbi:lipopolysaccharide biosynthesis protein [Shewanella livingstonensis]|uniref:Lipopolysaccharide biosynthesis protein n=1 Tax=Shewanella livingstonensis TaxID=150120 RepID=A0A3G8LWM4_9GAMM|nr:lipopolysaccharide biosynthesis protein [Shewanella livingstonensis]AZG74183.1 lipopolysaccharide biosynthesis protein [Shewanella livingstonensis]